jgi:hypothetical protein
MEHGVMSLMLVDAREVRHMVRINVLDARIARPPPSYASGYRKGCAVSTGNVVAGLTCCDDSGLLLLLEYGDCVGDLDTM